MRITIRTKMSRAEVLHAIRSVPAVVAGRLPDATGASRDLAEGVGRACLDLVRRNAEDKAAGGSGGDGVPWTPLKAATVRVRRSGKGTPLSSGPGTLLGSLSPGGTGNVLDSRPGLVVVGSALPHAAYQHYGTATVPARPLWPDPEDWPAEWWREMGEEARTGVARLVSGR